MEKSIFNVKIKDITDLYQDFLLNRATDEYLLGELCLDGGPVEALEAVASKIKNEFAVCFSLEANSKDDNYLHFNDLKIPITYLKRSKKFFLEADEKEDKVFVLDSKGNKDMFVRLYHGDIEIGFGAEETPDKEIISQENFQAVLERLGSLVETVMIGVFATSRVRVPRKTFWIVSEDELYEQYNPPNEGVKTKQSGKTTLITPEKISCSFESIGGQSKAKEEAMGIAQALIHPDVYRRWGTRPARGIMFHGPTGTGKTLLVKALASAVDANFYNIKSSEIFTMWYGESSNKIQKIFDVVKDEAIKSKKKSLLFFDEIDALVGNRDGIHEESQRVIQVLLTNLDGLETFEDLIIVAATNRKEAIDSAFLRPGRIDKLVEVPLPDAQGRQEIFLIHMNACEKLANDVLFEEDRFDWPQIKQRTDGMNGAEISEIVRRCLEEKVKQEISYLSKPVMVSSSDVLRHINNYEKRSIVKEIGFKIQQS